MGCSYSRSFSLLRKFKVTRPVKTVLAFLRTHVADAPSVKTLKRWIEGKRCHVNGRIETFSTHPLKVGDEVTLQMEEEKPRLKPRLLWEDAHLKVFDKPAGVVCTPAAFHGHLIHRLDKETSGILLVAKTKPFLEKMITLFRQKDVKKTYLALVDGKVGQRQGTVISRLQAKRKYQGQTVYGSGKSGQMAKTHWKIVKTGAKATLLECSPITGRTHQIRVHLKELGHPILGDAQYARHFTCPYTPLRHLLHACKISFTHPVTGEALIFEAPLPPDFLEALQKIGIVLH